MKNLLKNKKGFTLAEILLVIAIITILSGATVIGVASWLNSSKATAEKIAHDAADFEPAANESVKKKKGTLGSLPQETETLNTGATQNNNNNNNNDEPVQTDPPAPTATRPSETKPTPTKPSDTKPSDTKPTKPTQQTQATGGQGGSITVSNPSLTTAGSNVAGVISYTGSGDTLTVKLNAGNSNSSDVTDIKIKKQADGTYLIDMSGVDGGKYWILQNCHVDNGNDFWNNKKTRVMTAAEIESALHLTLS